ncbi:response regulator [bacterium]|nr:response regulator [bacterium]
MMAGIDGYEVCQKIKEDLSISDIKIILVSAKNSLDDRLEGYAVGADDYLCKPFDPEELLAKVGVFAKLKRAEKGWKKTEDELRSINEELRNNQIEIKELNKKLEQRVLERSEKLKDAQKEIVQKEYKSNMADITSGTLHNVKNIMNSIKISSEMASRFAEGNALKGFRKANELLEANIASIEEFICENPKGPKLMSFYLELGKAFEKESCEFQSDMARLRERIEAMELIVTTQQKYGGTAVVETVVLEKIIEDALSMLFGNQREDEMTIIRNFGNTRPVPVHKAKTMHVLINIIKNAREAMMDIPAENRILHISTYSASGNAMIKIKDNGVGISPENQEKLFNFGYTTKESGHGFGLHSCQAYMREMNGDILVESEGERKGTSIVLRFQS